VCLGPPCVLNLSASRRVDSVITSVILGDDFVPRLSVGSCYDLRDACLYLHSTQPSEMGLEAPPLVSSASPIDLAAPEAEPNPPREDAADQTLTGLILSRTHYDLPASPGSSLYQYPPLHAPLSPAEPTEPLAPDNSAEEPTPLLAPLPIPPIELFEYSQFTSLQPTMDLAELEEQRQVALRSLSCVMGKLQTKMTSPKLFPPGRIIHIVSREEWHARTALAHGDRRILGDDQQSVAYLSDQESFSSLQLSGNMFSCHLPTEYLTKLREMFPLTT
jgi:hypothetical protein